MQTNEQIKNFVVAFLENIHPISTPGMPYEVTPLATILKRKANSKAQVNVAIEWLPDILATVMEWPADRRALANDILLRKGVISIDQAWVHNNRKLMQIIERQVIRNRTEYERCKVALEDFPEAFTHAERESIERLMLKYEKF